LTDERCPVLSIVKALKERGWSGENRLVVHADATLRIYDGREALRMRYYYTLLLFALGYALPLSNGRIPSQEPAAYYRLLIKKIAVDPGMGNPYYVNLLNRNRVARGKGPLPLEDLPEPLPLPGPDEDAIISAGPDEPPDPKRRRGGGGGPIRGGGHAEGKAKAGPANAGASGSGGGPGGCPPAPPPVPLPPPGPPPPPAPPVEVEDAVVGAGDDQPEARGKRKSENLPWKDGLDGSKIVYNEYCLTGSEKVYKSWMIDCRYKHPGCGKTLGRIPSNTRRHGELEPVAELHAWRRRAWPDPTMPNKTHRNSNPSIEEVDSYLEENRDGLQAVWDRAMER